MAEMRELVIDRARWLRGEGGTKSSLLRSSDGKMCCLGFYMLANGHTPDELEDVDAPTNVIELAACETWLVDTGGLVNPSRLCRALMLKNDDDMLSVKSEEREHVIAALFAQQDIAVKFV